MQTCYKEEYTVELPLEENLHSPFENLSKP
jgi:hypothetical protein